MQWNKQTFAINNNINYTNIMLSERIQELDIQRYTGYFIYIKLKSRKN